MPDCAKNAIFEPLGEIGFDAQPRRGMIEQPRATPWGTNGCDRSEPGKGGIIAVVERSYPKTMGYPVIQSC